MTDKQVEEEFDIVWNGGPLLADRLTKPSDLWQGPQGTTKRAYNKRSEYWKTHQKESSCLEKK